LIARPQQQMDTRRTRASQNSEACNCAYSWASSIWCCDITRIPEAFLARPDAESTAAALLPFRECVRLEGGRAHNACQGVSLSRTFKVGVVGVFVVVLGHLQVDVAWA
jgi:TctA family transporter